MAASAVRYCQSTRSRSGPFSMKFSPSTNGSPVSLGFGFFGVDSQLAQKTADTKTSRARRIPLMTRDAGDSPIRGVFQALLLNLRQVFPDNDARAGIDELERIKHIIAGASRRLGRHSLQFAGEEIVSAFELL